jgi:hypothetical protein
VSSYTTGISAPVRPGQPKGVKVVAISLALMAIAGGLLIAYAALVLLALMYMDSSSGPSSGVVGLALGLVLVPAIGMLVVAARLWRGSAWARLAAQILFGYAGQGLLRNAISPVYGTAAAESGMALAMVAGCGAAMLYLERPYIRAGFGLQPFGIIGRHPGAAQLVAAVALALLAFSALTSRR